MVEKARTEHPSWEVKHLGSKDDPLNLVPMLKEYHARYDGFCWYIDPEVLLHVFVVIINSVAFCLQTRQISKGFLYDPTTDGCLDNWFGKCIHADHLPKWLLQMYKAYVYDAAVKKSRDKEHKAHLEADAKTCSVCHQGHMQLKDQSKCPNCGHKIHKKCVGHTTLKCNCQLQGIQVKEKSNGH
jgi:hypothetical protein